MDSSGRRHTAAMPSSDSDSVWVKTHMTEQEQCSPDSLLLPSVLKLCIDDARSIGRRASCRLRALVDPEALSPYQSAADTFGSQQP